MARSGEINWSRAGLLAALNTEAVEARVAEVAEELADRVQDGWDGHVEGIPGDIEIPVKVGVYKTDRPRASVHLAHPSGLAVQAKYGALTKAAADLGLEVQ
jgi:hypothetical protein